MLELTEEEFGIEETVEEILDREELLGTKLLETELLAREELLLLANIELLVADELTMTNVLEEDELPFELEILDVVKLLKAIEDITDVVEKEEVLENEILELDEEYKELTIELTLTELLLDIEGVLTGVSF